MKIHEITLWLLMSIWATLSIWPASFWHDAGQISLRDFNAGENPRVLYSGGPKRDFLGSYSVVLEDSVTHAIIAEDRSAVFEYLADRVRPEPITLDWWAPGLPDFPPGTYVLRTCWTIHRPFGVIPVPQKTVCTASNIFEVS